MSKRPKSPRQVGTAAQAAPGKEAEAQAPYGYAHRAHSPDPNADYSFNAEATRVLPTTKRLRWKVSG